MPSARLSKAIPSARSSSTTPHSRAYNRNTGYSYEKVALYAGNPIGLLLALTYAADLITTTVGDGDFRPNAHII